VVHEPYDQRQLLLSTLPPSQQQIRWAVGTIAALVVATAITVPFASVQLRRVDAFVPALITGIEGAGNDRIFEPRAGWQSNS